MISRSSSTSGTFNDIRAVFFDWGGTLVSSRRQSDVVDSCVTACIEALCGHDIAATQDAIVDLKMRVAHGATDSQHSDDLREFDTHETLRSWARDHALALPHGDALDACVDAGWRPWIGCLDVLDGAANALRHIRSRGLVTGLVSNCAVPDAICRVELERIGLLSLLDFQVFSSEIGLRKPHECVYALAMERAEAVDADLATDNVLFVGDTVRPDIEGPAAQGMRTALVRTGRWRGDESEFKSAMPDAVIDSVACLPQLLKSDDA